MIARNFPGVYVTTTDQSFLPTRQSKFRPGLVGVAQKGPFDRPTLITSLKDFRSKFGQSIPGTFLAIAAGRVSQFTQNTVIVRVGNKYENLNQDASGTVGTYTVYTPSAQALVPNKYVRISQTGKRSTVNALVVGVAPGVVTLDSGASGVALKDTYDGAVIDYASSANAANEAEASLSSTVFTPAPNSFGTAYGVKNEFQIQVTGDFLVMQALFAGPSPTFKSTANSTTGGDLLLLTETSRKSTREIMIKDIRPVDPSDSSAGTIILFETSRRSDLGYSSLPLQDNYSAATIYYKTGTAQTVGLIAASAGTWANGNGTTTGLTVRVEPGSTPDTKRFMVYENSTLVESIDNLSADPDSADYYETRINGKSSYIQMSFYDQSYGHPANTILPWSLNITKVNVPAFEFGFNGENASVQDFVGSVNANEETSTGIRAFEDTTDSIDINIVCAPGRTEIEIHQAIDEVCRATDSFGLVDSPSGMNGRTALDWHNGTGLYSGRGRLDTSYLIMYWDWVSVPDPFTGSIVLCPPTVSALRAYALSFDRSQPWLAVAGETRGIISDAVSVEFPRVPLEVKDQFMSNGNALNPIIIKQNRIMIFGERTLQRASSKLTSAHAQILVNEIARNIRSFCSKYVFDPNDDILLLQIRGDISSFMDTLVNERGIESNYSLVVDASNNTSATRNNKEVIVDLKFIPLEVAERILVNSVVRESGAVFDVTTESL